MSKTFTIYRSSAGSGKTRTLAKQYLKLALRYRADYFKHILAVTFTNKATQEMKDRILAYLDDFAKGRGGELASELKSELNFDHDTFQHHADEAQGEILHNYSQFSISTIDAFFQKVIRSFTREAGLVGDYRLEVEQDAVLEDVIDNLIDELGNNKELTEWVVEFAKENLENERAWDVRYSLIEFAREIFREEFKEIEDEVTLITSRPSFFKNLRKELWQLKSKFVSSVAKPAAEALSIIKQLGWDISDIYFGKNSGLFSFFEEYAFTKDIKDFRVPSDRIRSFSRESSIWPNKKSKRASEIVKVAETQLIPLLQQILTAYDQHYSSALSADVALRNMYVFGLITDIARKLKEYKDENNLMLLADAPKFLNGVIQDSDTPFIYEKVGSFYKNYLIDEFQDTSGMQWRNFLPLLTNSVDQGYQNMVVGDVKQAIYRWRGGDLKLLQEQIEENIGKERVEIKELNSNFRSASSIVTFNNALFNATASIIALETSHAISLETYADVAQKVSRDLSGYVQVQFLEEEKDGPTWKEQALEKVPTYLEQLQSIGVPLRDVAILVRKNEEGQEIVAHLLNYKNSESAKEKFRYDVVSNDSLRLDGAASVNLLLGAMKYLLNPDDDLARAQLAFEFSKIHDPARPYTEVFYVTNQAVFESYLPVAFTKEKIALKKLPLFELTETLIELFKLGEQHGELAYLQAFQDLVLEFSTRERSDLGEFIDWWEENKHKKSIQVSAEVEAVQILTIHKSKGLQFKYVIIPFCSWNLDHDTLRSPILWVTSEEYPFNDAGYVPVRYSSTLGDTLFKEYYDKERTRSYLDNLNLLYVALTRAEQGLLVTAPKASKKTVANLLHEGIMTSSLKDDFNEEKQQYIRGTLSFTNPASAKESSQALSLATYPASRWRDKLVIKQSARDFFNITNEEKRGKINYGLHMHVIFSRIRYESDIPVALNELASEGFIRDDEQPLIKEQLDMLLNNAQIKDWFSTRWDVRTEVPILLPGGAESRIDRLMLYNKKAVVVDFKTGEATKADQRQVLQYMEILRKMNYIEVEGYVLYLKTGEVVSLSPQRTRVVKKKIENQLGLDI